MAALAFLESWVLRELYSARGRPRSEGERHLSIARADQDLQIWKDKLHIELCLDRDFAWEDIYFMAALKLHFFYNDCLEIIHLASPYHVSWFNDKGDPSKSA